MKPRERGEAALGETGGKIKVLLPVYGLRGGGAERIVMTLANHLDRERFEPVIVLLHCGGEYLDQVKPDVKVVKLYSRLPGPKRRVSLLHAVLGALDAGRERARQRFYDTAPEYLVERVTAWNETSAVRQWKQGLRSIRDGVDVTYKELRKALDPGKMKERIRRHWEEFGIWKDLLHSTAVLLPYFESVIREERPDFILSNLLLANTLAMEAGERHGIPVAVCMHNTLEDFQTRVEYRHSPLHRARVIVTVSSAIARIFGRKYGQEKIRVIHNPHDTEWIRALCGEEVDHPWFVNKDLPVVMGMGRFHRQKNFPLLVDAVCALNREGACPVRLVLIGDGEERDRLEMRVRKQGQQDRVLLMDWDPNPFRFLARADLFVLSSGWEGLPNTLIEAMACGVPVVSTDCLSGPREILQDGFCGALVKRGDRAGLAGAIKGILKDRERSDLLRERGKRRAEDFRVSVRVPEYERMISGVVARQGPAGPAARPPRPNPRRE